MTPKWFVSQRQDAECGVVCLEMIVRFYGHFQSRELVRRHCPYDRQGTSLSILTEAAASLGFEAKAITGTSASALQNVLPCIAHWNTAHFVVVYKISQRHVWVADPAIGAVRYTREEFEFAWGQTRAGVGPGVALVFGHHTNTVTLPRAVRRERAQPILKEAVAVARRYKGLLGLTIGVVMSAQVVSPFVSAALVDAGILPRDAAIITLMIVAEAVLTISRILVEGVQSYALGYMGTRLGIVLVSRFLDKLNVLPLPFFETIRLGELMQRINDHQRIQQFLTDSVCQAVLAAMSFIGFGIILAVFQPMLFWVVTGTAVLYLTYCSLFFARQRRLSYIQFQLTGRNQGMVVEVLGGMQELKINDAQACYRAKWEAAQEEMFATQLSARIMQQFQTSGGMFINQVKNLAISYAVANQVVNGKLSFGAMVAIQTLVGQLSWPLDQIAAVICRAQDVAAATERSNDIYALPSEDEDDKNGPHLILPAAGDQITLSGVCFNYGATRRVDVLRDLTVTVPAGGVTALVGKSGCGKSTLIRLLLKAYAPQKGRIEVGGVTLGDLSHKEWRRRCGVVMQEGYLFSDTISENIALGVEQIDDELVRWAATVAEIDTFVNSLPLKYSTKIGRDGVGISRGQAQRILVARALYRRPAYLFMDEPTSALDADTEYRIVRNLQAATRGCTVIIAAHRLSTIRHADQIVVLDGGIIAEVGRHEELMGKGGVYERLMLQQTTEVAPPYKVARRATAIESVAK